VVLWGHVAPTRDVFRWNWVADGEIQMENREVSRNDELARWAALASAEPVALFYNCHSRTLLTSKRGAVLY
jgi:hypothetical protein